jgi:ATP-dependent protease HslVU (ClpYQ) peptidase subunit
MRPYPADFMDHVKAEQDRMIEWITETHKRWPEYRNEIVTGHLGAVVAIVDSAGLDVLQGVKTILAYEKSKKAAGGGIQ